MRARTGAVPPSVRRFSRRARRRRLRAAAPWAVVLAVALLAGIAWWAVRNTAVLAIRAVRVTGTVLLDPYDVHTAAAVAVGTPMARLDAAAVRRRVAALPAAGAVEVERDWPGTVRIRVRERTPVAAVPRGREYLWLDGTGVTFHTDGDAGGVPVVKLTAPGPADPSTRAVLRVLTELPAALADRVRAVLVASPAKITLSMRDGRTVVWGDAADSATKARTALALLRAEHRRIDVSSPDVVSVKP
ncbi:hypothetical protein GCM10010123_14100 [Pilimelia anulata]|uniref:POTRA domain-containing protein n=1 Tax=Pilimelia anulata TaxID=53371 RepID=A0A8J3B3Q1_9ACTN|nr:FtsQ-type POTRA domain-containing protein [Pilimelia anulata]GGJ85622.1 hypothetical protein GCM10010123_14100 [Pilimelia anulata]